MKTTILNYRIIVEKERLDNGKIIYATYVPTLGIADCGDTIDEALKQTEEGIKLYVETLIEEKEAIPPPDTEEAFMTVKRIEFNIPKSNFSFY